MHLSRCKVCRFELGHDEGWGDQICDACEHEIQAERERISDHSDADDVDDVDDIDDDWYLQGVEPVDYSGPIAIEKGTNL